MPFTSSGSDVPRTPDAIRTNIEAVAKLEEDYLRNRTRSERLSDAIADFSGSLRFVLVHIVFYGAWILYNLRIFPRTRPFDPFPFLLLSMIVSLEAIFLSTFVLIKQNRMSRRTEQRAHLDLQINLLAEREMTLVVQMLEQISQRLGVALPKGVVQELASDTSVEHLVRELEERLPDP
jgi:uncharacterized membrane protein